MFQTPLLFLLFNRLDTTKQVFVKIRELQPANLFISADGARIQVENEKQVCQEVRDWVVSQIDWDCSVTTRFLDSNMGCGKHVSSAISWFFEQVDEGIILEDDCVPHADFFPYCAELLERYRTNENIYVIGGNNFQAQPWGKSSYYFSAYGHIWGWATWKRAWKNYDFSLASYNDDSMSTQIKKYCRNTQSQSYWIDIFKLMKYTPIDTWDYQWTFCQWMHNGINIMPNVNLVSNIGFHADATHTKIEVAGISQIPTFTILPIIHPKRIRINRKADRYTFYKNFEQKKKNVFWLKVRDKIKCEFRKIKQL